MKTAEAVVRPEYISIAFAAVTVRPLHCEGYRYRLPHCEDCRRRVPGGRGALLRGKG